MFLEQILKSFHYCPVQVLVDEYSLFIIILITCFRHRHLDLRHSEDMINIRSYSPFLAHLTNYVDVVKFDPHDL